jgi:L-aspartate oxidase
MAWRVGAPVANLEFVQFHPTAFYRPEQMAPVTDQEFPEPPRPTFLISEAVRGEGGILKRLDGTTFMEHYHPQGCLAPRDVVARAIDAEMKQHGYPHVWLDLAHLDHDFVRERFPAITQECLDHGVDVAQHPIPVVPAAHYSCGGVITDCDGQTCIEGLFATGETACTGVHGANRLASNSLLEAVVYSHRAAVCVREKLDQLQLHGQYVPEVPITRRVDERFEEVRVRHCRDEVARLMWDYVGIVRSNERLALAAERLELLAREVHDYLKRGFLSRDLVELRNMTLVAQLIVRSARTRCESRGLHYNIDYPERDDSNFLCDTILPGLE